MGALFVQLLRVHFTKACSLSARNPKTILGIKQKANLCHSLWFNIFSWCCIKLGVHVPSVCWPLLLSHSDSYLSFCLTSALLHSAFSVCSPSPPTTTGIHAHTQTQKHTASVSSGKIKIAELLLKPYSESFLESNIHAEEPGASYISLKDERTIHHLYDFPFLFFGFPP